MARAVLGRTVNVGSITPKRVNRRTCCRIVAFLRSTRLVEMRAGSELPMMTRIVMNAALMVARAPPVAVVRATATRGGQIAPTATQPRGRRIAGIKITLYVGSQ